MVRPASLVISGGFVHGDSAWEFFKQSKWVFFAGVYTLDWLWLGHLFYGRTSLFIAAPRVG
jgi:hypothetical protein